MRDQTEPVSPGPGVLISLERGSGEPLHEQLERRLREQVRSGRLPPGSRLPSSRTLAAELGVSRGVVLESYAQLTAEGYLTTSQGAPTRVALTPSAERPPLPATSLGQRHLYDFNPALPDLASFPRDAWLRSLRTVLRGAPFDVLRHGDPRGAPELRNELMAYLGRARGAAPEPEHTIICTGFTQGYSILCQTLRERGLERIAIEDPGWARHRLVAERAGLEVVGVPVDQDGIDLSELEHSGCEAVVLTPAHQFPTGVVLSSERRAALLEWADGADALVIEDDYDSELRYDRVPLGALQGLAPERVCFIGSVSKRLAPGLRLGWMLSPSWLTGELTYQKAVADGGSTAIEQLALASFIARGELDRHLRRVRLRYRARRRKLINSLPRVLPEVRVSGAAAGLYALLLLPEDSDEHICVRAAARQGVGLEGLSAHRIEPTASPPGLVLGYANISEPGIDHGMVLLADALRESML